jgi:energy-coupling factor transport system ATP-binding protein
MNAIEISNVNYTYSKGTPFEMHALKDVSVSFKPGIITGLMGHTGSGKSTLVRLFNGLDKPDTGTVKVFGEDIWEKPKEINKFRFKVGLVFQYPEYQLFEETVYADIAYGPGNIKLSDDEIKKRVLNAAKTCGIDLSLLDKSPFDLSGGQKRRVAIAGVMAMEPEILVLDEPAAGLDPMGREEIFKGIKRYKESKNATVIIVSHSMEDMARYSDEIVVMNNAEVALKGTKDEIFAQADYLCSIGLDVPPIAYLSNKLSSLGLNMGKDCYSVENSLYKLTQILK